MNTIPDRENSISDPAEVPISGWIATGALVLAAVALFLPWRTATIFFSGEVSSNGFTDFSPIIGIISFAAIITARLLISIQLGYRSIVELTPSGPQREIDHLRLWIWAISAWLGLWPVASLLFAPNGDPSIGIFLEIAAAIVLAFSARDEYQDYR